MEMHALPAHNEFQNFLQNLALMHMMPYTGIVPWSSSATARGLGGGGNDKLAIDKGGIYLKRLSITGLKQMPKACNLVKGCYNRSLYNRDYNL